MDEKRANAQTESARTIIDALDTEFARLHHRSLALIETTPIEVLYQVPRQTSSGPPVYSVGGNVLRSAAAVEQTCGGITANLWDDPFEWTLPETLSTRERVIEYLEEVEATRKRAFDRFTQDSDLLKEVLVPSGEAQRLITLLFETLVRAVDFQGRAVVTLRFISDIRVPGFTG